MEKQQSKLQLLPANILKEGFAIEEMMRNNQLLLVYSNEFRADEYDDVLSLCESKINSILDNKKLQKRAFHIIVECVQNISRHQAKVEGLDNNLSEFNSILVVGMEDSGYFILTGNPVYKSKAPELKDKIDRISKMKQDNLRKLYKETMVKEDHNDKGGANLGLIDIARKAKGAIEYNFKTVNDKISFFTFKVNVLPE